MITDRMRQRKKRILHKLCIDMERSEYTSFSMLARLKCESQWTSIFIPLTWIRGDEVKRVGTVRCRILFFRVPYSILMVILIAAASSFQANTKFPCQRGTGVLSCL